MVVEKEPVKGRFLYFLLCFLAASPIIHSKTLLYGTVVPRTLYIWFIISILFLATEFSSPLSERKLKINKLDLAILALALVKLISAFTSNNFLVSFWSDYDRNLGVIYTGFILLFYYSIRNLPYSSNGIRNVLTVFILAALINSIWGLKDFSQMPNGRLTGFLSNPIHAAYFFLITIFTCIYLIVKRLYTNIIHNVILALILIVFLVSMFLTGGRTGLIALALGIVMLTLGLLLKNRSGKTISVLILLFILPIAIFLIMKNSEQTRDLYFRISSITDNSLQSRLALWKHFFGNINRLPFWGLGDGNYNTFLFENYSDNLNFTGSWYDSSHNIIIDYWINNGHLAPFILIFIIFLSYWSLFKNPAHFIDKGFLLLLLSVHLTFMFFGFENQLSLLVFATIVAISSLNSGQVFSVNTTKAARKPAIIAFSTTVLSSYLIFSIYSSLKELSRAFSTNNIEEKITSYRNAFESSLIGKDNVVIEMLLQREAVLNSNLPAEQKNRYFSEASEMANQYLLQYGKDYIILSQLGYLLYDFGQKEKGLAIFDQLRQIAPERLLNNYDYAAMLYQSGKKTEAIQLLDAMITLPNSGAKAKIFLASIYLSSKKTEMANKMLVTLNPEQIFQYFDDLLALGIQHEQYDSFCELLQATLGSDILTRLSNEQLEKWCFIAQSSRKRENVRHAIRIKAGKHLKFDSGGSLSVSDSTKLEILTDQILGYQKTYKSINEIEHLQKK